LDLTTAPGLFHPRRYDLSQELWDTYVEEGTTQSREVGSQAVERERWSANLSKNLLEYPFNSLAHILPPVFIPQRYPHPPLPTPTLYPRSLRPNCR
jgi:hypothetical protein